MTEPAGIEHFTQWRSLRFGDREITEGIVVGGNATPSPELEQFLEEWDGTYYVEPMSSGRRYVLLRETKPRAERWWLHIALLIITAVTTSLAGAIMLGLTDGWTMRPSLAVIATGGQFALPLLAILLAHESGHYVTARRYRVDVSPPFFIPFAPQLNIIGTLGAFIRLRSPVFDRRTLFDIGVAGPLAGLVEAIPLLAAGLHLSTVAPLVSPEVAAHQFIALGGDRVYMGDSLLLWGLRHLFAPAGSVLQLHALAVAGWVGLVVTMLNMLPLSQLDGGHVVFAMFGKRQTLVATLFWLTLLPLGRLWPGWWMWAVIALLLGRGRLSHPRIVTAERPLSPGRQRLGYVALVLFVLTFTPAPLLIR